MSTPNPVYQTKIVYKPWAVFQHSDFNLLLSTGTAMVLVSTLTTLISGQWLYETTNSAIQLGLLGAVHLIQMPVALYGGTLADSVNRKTLMIVTHSISFATLLTLTVLASKDQLAPWHIFAATGVSSLIGLLGGSARPAMLPRVLPRYLLINGVMTQNIRFQLAMVVGPLFFWHMFEVFGITTSLATVTVVALIATVIPTMIRASGQPEDRSIRHPIKSLKEGLTFIIRHQLLPGLFLLDMGVTAVSFYRMLFPVFADHLYGLGASGTGLLSAAHSAGAILGSSFVFFTTI